MVVNIFEIYKRRFKVLFYYTKNFFKFRYIQIKELVYYCIYPLIFPLLIRKIVRKIVSKGDFFLIFINGITTPLYWPKKFALFDLYQVLGELMDRNNWHYYEIPETEVKKEDVIVDCGSSEGLFGLKHIERAKQIFLIEPLPIFQESLKNTFKGKKNVVIIKKAINSKKGILFISEKSIKSSLKNKGGGQKIEVSTLDELFYEKGIKVDYIKADIEGFELEMLKGGKKLIRNSKPKIVIASYHKNQNAFEYI